jgi:hypothetical protein
MVAVVAISLIASCEYPNDAINVENQSTQTVTLAMVSDDTRIELTILRPGEGDSLRNECVEMDFVVEDEAGRELARRPGPFCQGDPPWIITNELLGTG